MNQAMLIGHIGSDPELRKTQNGTTVCNARVATNEKFTKKNGEKGEITDWHTVVAWSWLADELGKMKKGDPILVVGKIRTRKYQGKDGGDRYATEIIADTGGGAIKALVKSSRSGGSSEESQAQAPMPEDEVPF